jgi:hypothetical protein
MLKIDDIAEDQIVFYDIETTNQFAPYCELKMIGVQYGFNSEPELVESWGEKKRFRESVANPDFLKVQFNGINFDDIVLYRHGYPVEETNRHDVFLMAKTVAPRLPSYSLKFINWHYFGDYHPPEQELMAWLKKHPGKEMWEAPKELLRSYCLYDVNPQTINTFRLFWEVVQRTLHSSAYHSVELPMGLPLEEIMVRGGDYLDETKIKNKIATLQNDKLGWEDCVWKLTDGRVTNPNSTKQVGQWLVDEEQAELEITDAGNFSLKKEDVLEFLDIDNPDNDQSEIVRALYEVRKINNTLSYYRNYLDALGHNQESRKRSWIPKQYSLSGARTRRILSNSFYKLNFQNENEEAKAVQIIPEGFIGFWFDATQVENVVHIYESSDRARRDSYEADEEWNEYVWLCNVSLRNKLTKKELDNREKYPFPSAPHWSMYKGFKTLKLAANFGMGLAKYCKLRRITSSAGKQAFTLLGRACPAIKMLQTRVATDLNKNGYVQDVFGHIYSGDVRQAYKVVAYLIQGCGTGSLPKKQIRALYDIIHQWDFKLQGREYNDNYIVDKQRGNVSYGCLNGTTHDEISGRLSLALGKERTIATLQKMYYSMTKEFSPMFDNIPLRAKMYLAGPGEYATDRKEVKVKDIAKWLKSKNLCLGK